MVVAGVQGQGVWRDSMASGLMADVREEHDDATHANSFPLVSLDGAHDSGIVSPEAQADVTGTKHDTRGDDSGDDIRCGFLRWRPRFLQRFNNPPCLLFFFSLYALSLGECQSSSSCLPCLCVSVSLLLPVCLVCV